MDDERFHGPRDYLDAAQRPDASGEDLRALASSDYDFVRLAVAEHEAAPPDVLAELVPIEVLTWNDQDMLLRLARNNSTPTAALVRIGALIPPMLHVRDAQQAFRPASPCSSEWTSHKARSRRSSLIRVQRPSSRRL